MIVSRWEAHKKIKPTEIKKIDIPKETQERYELLRNRIDEFTKQKNDKLKELASMSEKSHRLQSLFEAIDEVQIRFGKSIESIKDTLSEFGIAIDDVISLKVDKTSVNKRKVEVEQQIDEISASIENPENGINKKIADSIDEQNKIVSEENRHLQEYNEYLNNLSEWNYVETKHEEEIREIENEILYLSNGIKDDLDILYRKRIKISSDILEEKKKIIEFYGRLKKPVDVFLKENIILLCDYSISIKSGLVIDSSLQQNIFDYINKQKKNVFRDDNYQLYKTLEELGDLESVDEYLKIPQTIIAKMNNYSESIYSQIKDGKILDFYNYLFGLGYLNNEYELVSENKTLDKLSPGERGALLLIFYLLLDLRDIPLIIDQPEDNLDNQSVAKILVPFIKVAKNRRQIILVTHNPNLAVVADSDQIIHVKIDKENECKVEVEAGGIENFEINKSVVSILEGTMASFKKRESKYII